MIEWKKDNLCKECYETNIEGFKMSIIFDIIPPHNKKEKVHKYFIFVGRYKLKNHFDNLEEAKQAGYRVLHDKLKKALKILELN